VIGVKPTQAGIHRFVIFEVVFFCHFAFFRLGAVALFRCNYSLYITLSQGSSSAWRKTFMGELTMDKIEPKGKITISLHQLFVEIEHTASYPDQISDMGNRAIDIFSRVMQLAKDSGMDIRSFEMADFGDDEDDD
jgi:hypothetical protein